MKMILLFLLTFCLSKYAFTQSKSLDSLKIDYVSPIVLPFIDLERNFFNLNIEKEATFRSMLLNRFPSCFIDIRLGYTRCFSEVFTQEPVWKKNNILNLTDILKYY
jgi:hypothetical protein